MTPEQIMEAPGARRGVEWLQAIRALSDTEFQRLTDLQVAEELRCEAMTDFLMGIGALDEEDRI